MPFLAAMLWLLTPVDSRCEVRIERLGPLRVIGAARFERPLCIDKTVQFRRATAIRALRARLLDDAGREVPSAEVSWIGDFVSGSEFQKQVLSPLAIATGYNEIRLPAGLALPVRALDLYMLRFRIINSSATLDKNYAFEASLELSDDAAAARGVEVVNVNADPKKPADRASAPVELDWTRPRAQPRHEHDHAEPPIESFAAIYNDAAFLWAVAPGTHSFSRSFRMPVSGRVHLISTRLLPHAVSARLQRTEDGRELLTAGRGAEPLRGEWLARLPSRAIPEGIPVRGGEEYTFTVAYENPGPGSIWATGIAHLLLTTGPESDPR